MNHVYFSQEDPRWRNVMYSNHGDKEQTIGTSACGPTSAAMAISSLTGKQLLPTVAAEYAVKTGYRTYNDGTAWGYFASIAKEYGLLCEQTGNLDTVKIALSKGALVVSSMGPGHVTSGGHYILLVGINGKWIDVFDPNHDNTKYGNDGLIDQGIKNDGKIKADELVFKREAKQYWIFNANEVKPVAQPKTKYPDVKAGHWAEDAIKAVSDAGVMSGDTDGAFRPSDPLTRAEAAVIVAKLLK